MVSVGRCYVWWCYLRCHCKVGIYWLHLVLCCGGIKVKNSRAIVGALRHVPVGFPELACGHGPSPDRAQVQLDLFHGLHVSLGRHIEVILDLEIWPLPVGVVPRALNLYESTSSCLKALGE